MRFTYFDTESGYDFLTVQGFPAFSGNQVPQTLFLEQTTEITWRSDGSVTRAGWTFFYEPFVSNAVAIQVPRSAIPAGASSLLVISASSGGEMTTGVTTALLDYNPPSAVPQSVQFQDTDTSIGFIAGTCTVTRAADETGVSSYEIFSGNRSHSFTSLGSVPLSTVTGAEVAVPIPRMALLPNVSHLWAFTVGSGGVAPSGVSTPVLDDAGLTLAPESLDFVGTPNSNTTQQITLSNVQSTDVMLNVELILEDASAESMGSVATASTGSSTLLSSSLPLACAQGGNFRPDGKHQRLLYKVKAGAGGRRLARRLEGTHGAKVKQFDRLGGLAYAEFKNSSQQNYCQIFSDLQKDPTVEFVEEDQIWHAIEGGGFQAESELFPPKTPVEQPRLGGRMHRRPRCADSCESTSSHPNDEDYSQLWGMHQDSDVDIDAPEAWAIHKGLSGRVIVAVIDTGVDYNHEDLRNQMWRNPGEIAGDGIDNDGNGFVDDVFGYDFASDHGDPMDTNGHGTHCAGTIGAEGGNSLGVVGVSWKPQIMAPQLQGPSYTVFITSGTHSSRTCLSLSTCGLSEPYSRKVAGPPGVLFAKQRFLHRPSALQDLIFEV